MGNYKHYATSADHTACGLKINKGTIRLVSYREGDTTCPECLGRLSLPESVGDRMKRTYQEHCSQLREEILEYCRVKKIYHYQRTSIQELLDSLDEE